MIDNNGNLNGKSISLLIDFDLIVNTELGLIRFIRDEFRDERAFVLETVDKSDREILSLLYSRKNKNPISVISTEENLGDIDELYTSFFTNYKQEIIDRSVSEKNIMAFVANILEQGTNFGTSPLIVVADELEEQEIQDHFRKGNCIFKNATGRNNIINADAYYIRDYRFFADLSLEDKIRGKKIYMSPMQFNLDYFEENENPLTSMNVLTLIGKDYKTNKEK